MKLNLARVFADAAALWQHDRDLWLRVAGFLFFVPALALQAFLPFPDLRDLSPEAAQPLILSWVQAQGGWLFAYLVAQTFGYGVVLTLVLDPSRPPLGAAILRTLRQLPWLVLAYLAVLVLAGTGFTLFILPGLYILGRTVLTLPILIAEPARGPMGALIAAVRRSHGRGWRVLLVTMSAFSVTYLLAGTVAGAGRALGSESQLAVRILFDLLLAGVATASALAQALLQAALYRSVGEARQGI
jgi:hypothetical protein